MKTRARKRAANVMTVSSERNPQTNESRVPRKRKGIRQLSRKQTVNTYEDDEQRLVGELEGKVHVKDAEDEDEAIDEVLV